ncbi:hypothetical protein CLAFUW4_04913 [Fulvia fulva]|uniref:SET domain-containing protein n=1 Tax=Passalora fulva TaxID=5499 RepID=A0A9Q8PHT7_PASFU|nr:uncharacterized protein CLAFUR5_11992 [Fulvia fulva]KAK4626558.1 hypothetical protein CLAFUR4_04899 [Fulvia fulva]KAK4627970.1 hypothetical protein CLAFUR0_04903 [Fulvia fulva]UJO22904.1 hypothetical protein CLAFUR5_11992 [Fulvia fulva]WPV14231.1 hypothetical protein CLAFUW4_04913 [Fulvia fulva]WPV28239.1 hypothetical protein CLAFUW7_04907 [Fulvia fulva]
MLGLNNARNPKYSIDVSVGTNKRMRAAVDIRAGACILEERPLFKLDIALSRLYDIKSVTNEEVVPNGVKILQIEFARADYPTKQKIIGLYHGLDLTEIANLPLDEQAHTLLTAIIKLNAWSVIEQVDGQEHTILIMYNELSRINNSCTPNAMISWNAVTGRGSLHALQDITTNTEITIEYLAEPKDCFQKKTDRIAAIKEAYRFTAIVRCVLLRAIPTIIADG